MDKFENHEMEPTKNWGDVEQVVKLEAPGRRSKVFLVKYDGFPNQNPDMHAAIFDTLVDRFKGFQVAMLVGTLACGAVVAFVKKTDTKALPNLLVDGAISCVYLNNNGHVKMHEEFLDTLLHRFCTRRSNMLIRRSQDNLSVEGLVSATAHLSKRGMATLHGNLLMKSKKARTEADQATLRAWGALTELGSAFIPPTGVLNFETTVPPSWSDLSVPPSQQFLVHADLEKNTMKTITLKAWVDGSHPDASHLHRALLMLGDAGTGKTPVSLLLAKQLTDAYRAKGKEGRAVSVSEPEALPRLLFAEGDVVCVQELNPSLREVAIVPCTSRM